MLQPPTIAHLKGHGLLRSHVSEDLTPTEIGDRERAQVPSWSSQRGDRPKSGVLWRNNMRSRVAAGRPHIFD
jgi:hypothetical protein